MRAAVVRLRPTRIARRRFVPPWEQDGKPMEAFFEGVMTSRNPYERFKRDTERYESYTEKAEGRESFESAEGEADRLRAEAAAAAEEDEMAKFLPYGAEPLRYFERSNVAAWGKYIGGVAQSGAAPRSSSNSNEPVDGYSAATTQQLLLNDMDAPVPYAYESLPPPREGDAAKAKGGAYPWPLGGTMGLVLDIDGVIYRAGQVLEGSDSAVKMMQRLKIPFIFMTNSGSGTEAAKAQQLTDLLRLDQPIRPEQIVMAYSPMRSLVDRHGHENVLVAGKGNVVEIAKNFGFENAVGMLEYQAAHPELVPLKSEWSGVKPAAPNSAEHTPFGAIIVMNDLADNFNDVQVMLDVAISPMGLIGEHISAMQTVPIYWPADDLLWAAGARLPRLGGGAHREMFAAAFMAVTGREAEVTCYGKPRAIAYAYAEGVLAKEAARLGWAPSAMRTIAMVGDNLETDIVGANARGKRWLSAHVLTGVGSAPAAARTISPQDAELQWLTDFPNKAPHYIAPSLDHFLREAMAFGEETITMHKKPFYGKPCPVDLEDQYGFTA